MTLLTAGSTPYTCGVHWNGGELYNVIEHIGKGAFADVYKFATKREGQLVAVKELEKRRFLKNGILDHKVTNELKIMQCLNHVRLVCISSFHMLTMRTCSRTSSSTSIIEKSQHISSS
jgi:serine/threonine protein kinase